MPLVSDQVFATLLEAVLAGRQAPRLAELAEAVARSPDAAAAQAVDFAFMTELAQAAGNLVFVLVLNAIRSLYFEHAERLQVAAGHEELAPYYSAAALAVEAR